MKKAEAQEKAEEEKEQNEREKVWWRNGKMKYVKGKREEYRED